MKPNGAPPDLKDELDRKVMETIEWLFCGLRDGRLTKEQFSTGIDTLFMSVSGLVSRDFISLITAAQEELEGYKPVVRKVLLNAASLQLAVIEWMVGEDAVLVRRIDIMVGESGVRKKNFPTSKEAAKFMDNLGAAFASHGYREI